MTALTYGIEAWANIRSVEMRETEKIQKKSTKKDISFNNLYWYHNGNRNMASTAEDPICCNSMMVKEKSNK